MPQLWEVVGGQDKGGILVRAGKSLTSRGLADRLSTGAVVEELELEEERLHYRLQEGTGPEEGWVSISVSGKDLLKPRGSEEEKQLLGVWCFAHDDSELQITTTSSGQLRCYRQFPPVLDVFGSPQKEGEWYVATLKLRNGYVFGFLRLKLVDAKSGEATLAYNFRSTGEDEWDDGGSLSKLQTQPDLREARGWSPELTALHASAEEALRDGLGGDGSGPWPRLNCTRLLAWSDLHIDMGQNFQLIEAVERHEGTALVVSGDVCTGLAKLEEALAKCKERFDEVFYVPGNHELWADGKTEDGRRQTSLEKFVEILRICKRTGVRTSPAFLADGVAVCPMFSWYKATFTGSWVPHGGFDNTTFWPEVDEKDSHNPQLPEIADFFASLNKGRVAAAAALRESEQLRTLWTFSHFLPRRDLHQGGYMLGVLGCTELEEQIREAGTTGHLFGHTHQGTERMIDGVRYVQQPLGYPYDGHREERPLMLWTLGAEGQSAASILACLPEAAAALAADRIRGAIWGALCADALGMPAQWYYGGPSEIRFKYKGLIKDYVKPIDWQDHSFMLGSITPAIGKVINHGKAKYWGLKDPSKSQTMGWHHHFSLKAGENTLEGHMLRLYMRLVTRAGGDALDPAKLRDEYIRFMTTKGSHNDCFACVYHRVFFARLDEGMPPEDCPEGGDDIETIESVSTLIAVILAAARRGPEQAENEIYQAVRVTRKCTRTVAIYGRVLSAALRRVLAGEGLADVAEAINAELHPDWGPLAGLIQGRKDPMASTFLVESFPSLLHYLFRYADSTKDLVLANVNSGGEQTHRGHILGALAGAAHGMAGIPPEWIDGLVSRNEIKKEVEAFVAAIS